MDKQEYAKVVEETEEKVNKEFVNFQLRDLSYTDLSKAADDFGPTTVATKKRGYLMSAEKKTYGMSWTKKFYYVVDDILMQQEGTDPPLPALNLQLCTVKLATEIERNFCFFVISPQKALLLQAQDSKALQEWVFILQDGACAPFFFLLFFIIILNMVFCLFVCFFFFNSHCQIFGGTGNL